MDCKVWVMKWQGLCLKLYLCESEAETRRYRGEMVNIEKDGRKIAQGRLDFDAVGVYIFLDKSVHEAERCFKSLSGGDKVFLRLSLKEARVA